MCTGNSKANRAGSNIRRAGLQGGKNRQRAVGTKSLQSDFRKGDFREHTGYSWQQHDPVGSEGEPEYRHTATYRTTRVNSEAELNALKAKTNDYSYNKTEWVYQDWGSEGGLERQTKRVSGTVNANPVRIGGGGDWVNTEKANNQSRVRISNEAKAKRKTRGARGQNQSEARFRSGTKGKGGAKNGLRIGGSGTQVPGGAA